MHHEPAFESVNSRIYLKTSFVASLNGDVCPVRCHLLFSVLRSQHLAFCHCNHHLLWVSPQLLLLFAAQCDIAQSQVSY